MDPRRVIDAAFQGRPGTIAALLAALPDGVFRVAAESDPVIGVAVLDSARHEFQRRGRSDAAALIDQTGCFYVAITEGWSALAGVLCPRDPLGDDPRPDSPVVIFERRQMRGGGFALTYGPGVVEIGRRCLGSALVGPALRGQHLAQRRHDQVFLSPASSGGSSRS